MEARGNEGATAATFEAKEGFMTGRVRKTDRAQRDIDRIADWIARRSPNAAENGWMNWKKE